MNAVAQTTVDRPARAFVASLVVLFKLRVVALLLLAAITGLMLAAGGRPAFSDLLLLIITGAMAAAGASALNEYIEQGADAQMRRTRRRPLAVGAYARPWLVAAVAVGLVAGAMLVALAAGNLALMAFLGAGAFIYVVIYTVVLKPRTPLNIVLGGAAGSAAVLSGSAAAGNWADPGALLLAALVFVWTPTHFWSLSMVYRDDYVVTAIPMLPAVMPPARAAFWMLVHAAFTGGIALAMVIYESLGLIYLLPVAAATFYLLRESVRLVRDPRRERALRVFKGSNLYLAVVLLAACADALLHV